jgi:hypothetical protein
MKFDTKGRNRPALVFGMIILVATVGVGRAAEYEVAGNIEQTIHHDTSPPGNYRDDFVVYVRDCSWLIQVRPHGSANPLDGYFEVGSTNGTDIYQLNVPPTPADGGRAALSVAQVYSNSAPVDYLDNGVAGHLWMMFASGCQLRQNTNNLLPPVYDVNAAAPGNNPGLEREAIWELLGGPGTTPARVTFILNPIRKTTNAVYVAAGKTNSGSNTVAAGFRFTEYLGADAEVHKEVVCVVTSLRAVCTRANLLPSPAAGTLVGDFRAILPSTRSPTAPVANYLFDPAKGWLPPDDAAKESLARP